MRTSTGASPPASTPRNAGLWIRMNGAACTTARLLADRADRKGFLLLGTALPINRGQSSAPGYQKTWEERMARDLRRYYNHPSVVIWTTNPELARPRAGSGPPLHRAEQARRRWRMEGLGGRRRTGRVRDQEDRPHPPGAQPRRELRRGHLQHQLLSEPHSLAGAGGMAQPVGGVGGHALHGRRVRHALEVHVHAQSLGNGCGHQRTADDRVLRDLPGAERPANSKPPLTARPSATSMAGE